MTALKDWEKEHALLHKHDSVKFLKPTPRGLKENTPVFQQFKENLNREADRRDIFAACVAVAAMLAVAAIRWFHS